MKSVMRITLFTTLLLVLAISTVYAATESRTALATVCFAVVPGPTK